MSESLNGDRLAAIEARLNAGEQWTADDCQIEVDPDDGYVFVPETACLGDTMIQLGGHYEDYQPDWVFAAHSRDDVRALLGEVKRLRSLIKAWIVVALDAGSFIEYAKTEREPRDWTDWDEVVRLQVRSMADRLRRALED